MQSIVDYACSACHEKFENASSLLKHFAFHASIKQIHGNTDKSKKKNPIPDLYPIKPKRFAKCESFNIKNKIENEDNVDSGFEDVNPIRYCQVSMADKKCDTNEFLDENDETTKSSHKSRCFICIYCSKSFGWSTDLKRHVLIHTGERPFKCDYCKLSFTRNFHLQKHKLKYHGNKKILSGTKVQIPLLKPLDISIKHKSRKQDKSNIKRKMCSTNFTYQSKTYRYS